MAPREGIPLLYNRGATNFPHILEISFIKYPVSSTQYPVSKLAGLIQDMGNILASGHR